MIYDRIDPIILIKKERKLSKNENILLLKEKKLSKILSDFLISWFELKLSMLSMIRVKMKNTKKTSIFEHDLNNKRNFI